MRSEPGSLSVARVVFFVCCLVFLIIFGSLILALLKLPLFGVFEPETAT